MTGYYVPNALHGEVNSPELGSVAFEYESGSIDAKDAAEEALLASLVESGLVELSNPSKPKNKATKSETPSEDKE